MEQIKSESERQQREIREAETRRLELEAKLQRETAERAAAEKLQAEKGRQQAETFAAASRRKTRIATAGFGLAMLFFLMAAAVAWWANDQRKDALAGELLAMAENLAKNNPDQSVLLALAARRISAIPRADSFIRYARANYTYRSVLRGHEDTVSSAQFSPDGKTVVTASVDKTARLWDVATGRELQVLRGHEDRV